MYSDLTLEERKEVTAIRRDLTAFFNKIKFDEPTHSYTINGKKLQATSHFIHRYKPHFDIEKMSALVAQKQGRTREEVKEEWEKIKNDSCTLGTAIHLFGEDYVNSNFTLEPKNEFEKAIVAFWDTKPKHIVPVKLELQMYSEEFGIAGTADIICYNLKTKRLKLLDYKTNRDLFKNYKEQKMLPPFDNFLDCSFNMYKLQLSMYQYFLEQTGYEVESRTLIWLKPDGTYETHKIESVKDTLLEEMIKYKNQ